MGCDSTKDIEIEDEKNNKFSERFKKKTELNQNGIKKEENNPLKTSDIYEIIHKESVTSTMPESNNYIDKMDIKKPFILNADQQTQGKGTGNRKWNSSIIGNVYTTTCIPDNMIPENLKDIKVLNKIISLSIIDALNDIKPNEFFVKQPNDILCKDGCKMGGILIKPYNNFYTIGFGVNLVGKPEDDQIREGGKKACFLANHLDDNTKIPSALDFSKNVSYKILDYLQLTIDEIQKKYFSHELTGNILIGGVIKNFIK
jgi:biotin-(acetyl-CoA carboxylase) ligase